jgi:hypothetical protein
VLYVVVGLGWLYRKVSAVGVLASALLLALVAVAHVYLWRTSKGVAAIERTGRLSADRLLGRLLDLVAGLLEGVADFLGGLVDLVPGLLHGLVDLLARSLCRTFLLASRQGCYRGAHDQSMLEPLEKRHRGRLLSLGERGGRGYLSPGGWGYCRERA